MLTTIVLPMLVSCSLQAPTIADIQSAKEVTNIFKWAAANQVILVAGGRRSAPGPDHGDDPNDEQHQDIPAWNERNKHRPSGDPYNGSTDNNKGAPFTPY